MEDRTQVLSQVVAELTHQVIIFPSRDLSRVGLTPRDGALGHSIYASGHLLAGTWWHEIGHRDAESGHVSGASGRLVTIGMVSVTTEIG